MGRSWIFRGISSLSVAEDIGTGWLVAACWDEDYACALDPFVAPIPSYSRIAFL